ncbi:MAG: hypothetical protein KZQ99_03155 [Candidatus Thiodiazotropha sp. (ex Dulcina madagascariensis)]|nr:hypothetical protein [Candidatus Thiodiazotropha sp. (ex Dulcina madagascariensis)]
MKKNSRQDRKARKGSSGNVFLAYFAILAREILLFRPVVENKDSRRRVRPCRTVLKQDGSVQAQKSEN